MNISETSEIVFGKMKVESVVDERLHLAEISVSARNYFFLDPVILASNLIFLSVRT